jgi:hypothetical protein
MIQTIKQIKISEIVEAIQRMGVNQDTLINLTIETIEEDITTGAQTNAAIATTAQQIAANSVSFAQSAFSSAQRVDPPN